MISALKERPPLLSRLFHREAKPEAVANDEYVSSSDATSRLLSAGVGAAVGAGLGAGTAALVTHAQTDAIPITHVRTEALLPVTHPENIGNIPANTYDHTTEAPSHPVANTPVIVQQPTLGTDGKPEYGMHQYDLSGHGVPSGPITWQSHDLNVTTEHGYNLNTHPQIYEMPISHTSLICNGTNCSPITSTTYVPVTEGYHHDYSANETTARVGSYETPHQNFNSGVPVGAEFAGFTVGGFLLGAAAGAAVNYAVEQAHKN